MVVVILFTTMKGGDVNEKMKTEVTLLRTMTEKSVFSGGKYNGVTVGQVLALGKTGYLRHLYYTYTAITFTDDILEKIYVPVEYRIKKPGSDIEIMKIRDKDIESHTNRLRRHIIKGINKNEQRRYYGRMNRIDRRKFSKGSMQAWNQGKK